jgi:hypothetical protein
MTAVAVFVLSCSGFVALALSMHRHHRDLFGRPPAHLRKLALNVAGWALLCASVVASVIGQGVSIGFTLWFGIITLAALLVAVSLTYVPRVFSGRSMGTSCDREK